MASLAVSVNWPEPLASSKMQVKRTPSASRGSPPMGEENEDCMICMSLRVLDPSAV